MNSSLERSLLHTYSDRAYKHSALINHRGTVVAFAMDDRRRIYYSVLDLAKGDMSQGDASEIDASFWLANPKPVTFPYEIEQAGFAVLDTVKMPAVKHGTTQEVAAGSVPNDELDPFLSTTARLTADAPFQVLSDGTHVYLFRQAINKPDPQRQATGSDEPDLHPLYKREDGGATAGIDGRLTDDAGAPVPLVDRTLLVDRYVLAGAELKRTREVRYRRSRNRTRPASAKDSLGAKDMTGVPFYEPTKEVDFVGSLTPGNASVLLLPTIRTDEQRWQIFAFDAETDEVRSINCARDGDGFFDTKDLRDVRFTLEGRTAGAGLTAELYYEQEQLPTEDVGKTVKQHARVLLCAATKARDGSDDKPYVAAVDFAVTRDGTLTEISSEAEKKQNEAERKQVGENGPPKTPVSQEEMDALDAEIERLEEMKDVRDQLAYASRMRSATFYQHADRSGKSFKLFAGQDDEHIDARDLALTSGDDQPPTSLIGYLEVTDEDTVVEFFSEDNYGGESWTLTASATSEGWPHTPASVRVSESDDVRQMAASAYQSQTEEPPPDLDHQLADKRAKRDASVVATEALPDEAQDVEPAQTAELRVVPMPALTADTAGARRVEEALADVERLEAQLGEVEENLHSVEGQIALIVDARASAAEAAAKAGEVDALNADIEKAKTDLRTLIETDRGDIKIYDRSDRDLDGRNTIDINVDHNWPKDKYETKNPEDVKFEHKDLYKVPRYTDSVSDMFGITSHWGNDWGKQIEYVEIGSKGNVKVTLFKSENFKGDSKEITSSTKLDNGTGWKSEAKSLRVEFADTHKGRIRAAQGRVKAAREAKAQAEQLRNKQKAAQHRSTKTLESRKKVLQTKRGDLLAKLADLRRIRPVTQVPQPLVHCHTDGQGLTVRSGLLQFAYTDAPPVLFESAVGRVSMYFKGVNDQFFAAYYDLRTARAQWTLPAEHGEVVLTSQTADVGYNETTIRVSDGSTDDLCTIEIHAPHAVEHWAGVPRDAESVVAVLNGTAMRRQFVGKVAVPGAGSRAASLNGGASTITLEDATAIRIPAHALLVVEPPEEGAAALRLRTETATASGEREIVVPVGSLPVGSAVYLVRYDSRLARVTPNAYSLAGGSPSVIAKLHGAEGAMKTGESEQNVDARCPLWTADAPGTAFALDGEQQHLFSPTPDRFSHEGDVTMEAWVHPISVDGLAEVVHAGRSEGDGYALGLGAAESESGLLFPGDGHVSLPIPSSSLREAFTIEAWVRLSPLEESDPPVQEAWEQPILSSHGGGLEYYFVNDKVNLIFNWKTSKEVRVKGMTKIPRGEWVHLACTYEANGSCTLYVNGEQDVTERTPHEFENSEPLRIGRWSGPSSDYHLYGTLDEVRVWSVSRSQDAIQADMERRLDEREPGLLGRYSFTNGDASDRSGNGYHGTWEGETTPSVVYSPLPAHGYLCMAAVGDDVIESTQPIPANKWTHLAAVYDQSYALRFGGDAYADVGKSATLDVTGDLTIEAFLQADRFGRPLGILSKGTFGSLEDGSEVPYAFSIDASGFLVFEMETGKDEPESFTSTLKLTAGRFHRVAVVRETTVQAPDDDKSKDGATVETSTSVTFYLDGEEAGTTTGDKAKPQGNRSPLYLGQARLAHGATAQFTGAISEVRIYSQALDKDDIGKPLGKDTHGLTAWWRLEENRGLIAYDSKGDSHARLFGPTWIKTPQPNGSTFRLYVNGAPVEAKPIAESDLAAGGSAPRFTIGGGEGGRHFDGILEEVRIWKTARRQEQLLDNVFTRLRGETRDLIAYYTFDDVERAGDGQPTRVEDSGPRGNHLQWATGDTPNEVLSTAPISSETAEVRSALSGVHTNFHATMDGRAGAAEYADLQRDAEGNLHGVHKRCYAYVQDGRWVLVTGYKVGNIKTEWIGQAQFDPQVMGFIEGGPPIPSENFTEGAIRLSYSGTSEVTLVESQNVTTTVSSSHEDSVQTGFEVEASLGVGFGGTSIVAAPLGAGVSYQLPEVAATGRITGGATANGAWAGGESLGAGVNTSTEKSVAVGGGWDQADDRDGWSNPDYTRRWVPSNMGFAFVQSETADMFALCLEHTGTLVGLRMLPNPDIPRDVNIIPFPINNRYTKQGTLDGRLGFTEGGNAYDPDYESSADYGEYSYFKPREAYRLKRRIQEEEEKLKAYFASFDTTPQETQVMKTILKGVGVAAGAAGLVGGAAGAGVGLIGGALAGGIGGTVGSAIAHLGTDDEKLAEKFARRNIVNTYVWTADGGFYEESTEVSEVRSESASGSYSLSGELSGGVTLEFDGPFSASAGLTGTVGGGISTSLSKDKDEETSFQIDMSLDVPDDLGQYEYKDPEDLSGGVRPVYDSAGDGVNHAGKVDAYRFMTFYLEPKRDNFEDLYEKVIDPIWLEQSSHPNAAALRQANQAEQKPLCWRVFHRVTFVSRVLPDFPTGPEAHAEQLKRVDIGSSYELVRRLEPDVKDHTADPVAFRDAVRKAVHKRLPELADENDLEQIILILSAYYGVTE